MIKAEIRRADKKEVTNFIQTYHYSKQMPSIVKEYLGWFDENGNMIGAITLGWGTRPKHTIKKLWPQLDTQDYYEIGKMAVSDELPKNAASQMLSTVIKFVRKELPQIKVIFTWADGMLGKVGYVYQASNFYYLGFAKTDTYLTSEGERVHPRTADKFRMNGDQRTTKYKRPTDEQLALYGWSHYEGRQFKYAFIVDRKSRKELLETCTVDMSEQYPKEHDLAWRIKVKRGVWVPSPPPPFRKESTSIYDNNGKIYAEMGDNK